MAKVYMWGVVLLFWVAGMLGFVYPFAISYPSTEINIAAFISIFALFIPVTWFLIYKTADSYQDTKFEKEIDGSE